ncbi:PAS domain S-box protein [Thermodesulfobacteriota bacterium]
MSLILYEELEQNCPDIRKECAMRKQSVKSFMEAKELFEKTFISQLDAIFILNSKIPPVIIDCNPAAILLFGYSRQEIIGQPANCLHVDETSLQYFQAQLYAEIAEHGFIKLPEYRMRRKDGSVFFTEHSIIPLTDDNGQRIGWVSVVRDITGNKHAHEEIIESEKRFRDLTNALPQTIFETDENGKLTFTNNIAFDLFGYNRNDFDQGLNALDMLIPQERAGAFENIQTVMSGKKLGPVEYTAIRKDGSTFPVAIHSDVINRNNRAVGLRGILIDLTEQKKLEAQLLHAQKMEAIGTLSSGISHNFRNILTVISMNCQIFQRTYKNDRELMKSIDSMLSYVDRGTKLVNELLEFSRKKSKSEFQSLNLSDILKEIYQLLRHTYDKLIDIRLSVPESITIYGDYSEISQVFMNICANARDAMPAGGILRIDASIQEHQARVVVSDTGEGMDQGTVQKCFEPFFTTKPVDKGTGLGLSTAYGTMKKHGGEITVHSELGKGTAVTLYFPLSLYDVKTEPEVLPHTEPALNKKVLIVDDEVQICRLIKKLLIKSGYQAEYVDNGKAAIEKYHAWRPDVVLLDRNMPGMDGMSCAEKIINYDSRAKIIIVSGYDENGSAGLTAHQKKLAKVYLTKPIQNNVLQAQLADVLNS